MKKRILAAILSAVMCLSTLLMFAGCPANGGRPDALVIMTDECDGLFNPFFSTTASDGTIVGMTQISMLTTEYVNGEVKEAYGDDHAVVVKDYNKQETGKYTVYTFVLKNNLKFSDGEALTINDVLFNLYVYLDPVYTGSSTMYSTDIVGLLDYRTQTKLSESESEGADALLSERAANLARTRIDELINAFRAAGLQTSGNYSADYNKMVNYIKSNPVSSGYKEALAVPADRDKIDYTYLLADYELALKLFREELHRDYASAKESYTEEPYKSTGEFDEITSFMYAEGMVRLEYEEGPDGKEDKSKIKNVIREYATDVVVDEASAVEYVFNTMIETKLDQVLAYWATAQELLTQYTAAAKTVILHENITDGELAIPNISGIVSLGHTANAPATVTGLTGTTYNVATEYDADGAPVNDNEYAVLQITINGIDPKAIWNFAFAVAPHHYYSDETKYPVDIANNKFGVEYGSASFMKDVIQSQRNVKLPMGAGAYKVSNVNNSDTPGISEFFSNNVAYFKANENFMLGTPKIEKVRYQVVGASNALNMLESGQVHFVTPQFTQNNINKINDLKKNGIESTFTDQLGYGYIGINAGKVQNIYLRKAIMTAMNTSLALNYYSAGMADTIYYPMSTVSWAYPGVLDDGKPKVDNSGHSYISMNWNKEDAIAAIEEYMLLAGVSAGDKQLDIDFTIAGANLTDHPTYNTFLIAAEILNDLGWNIEVKPDTQALSKLSTGSLAVWAAAWGSAIDPDLYQVYHKNSTATSTLAWGYREILANPNMYPEETVILNDLSALIDDARETNSKEERARMYEEAMSLILDMAVEMPVYQRKVLYAYNANVINTDSLPGEINPYTSPLDRIWEIEFAE